MNNRVHWPEIGWPVFDLKRRKFGICIGAGLWHGKEVSIVHIEGDRFPSHIVPEDVKYEYPKFYNNDEVAWTHQVEGDGMDLPPRMTKDLGYYIKHVHYHVPRDVWQYTIARQGMEGFDRILVEDESSLELITRFVPKI
jgi:hypothetical protein